MADIFDPSDAERADWALWCSERPPAVRAVAERLQPWKLYRLKPSGHRVTIVSIDEPEDGSEPTLKVDVSGRFNFVAFERHVFGVKPEDLVECDLPGPEEKVGSADLTREQVREHLALADLLVSVDVARPITCEIDSDDSSQVNMVVPVRIER